VVWWLHPPDADPAPALPGAVIPQENEAEPAPALQASDAESASSTDPLA
jgi:hypothetical protein